MPPKRRWVIREDPGGIRQDISREFDLSEPAARLLSTRLAEPTLEAADAFLNPSLSHLHAPESLLTMEVAVDRIIRAMEKKEPVVIYGDYDTDGVTAAALLLRIFRALEYPVRSYLPDRVDEGYGISDSFIRGAVRDKVGLVITVDCGVSNIGEVTALGKAGIDVIITDHHEPGGEMPEALAIINPKRDGSAYPFRELTGVGVAFKLAWALCERVSASKKVRPELREALLEVLPYVAIGTITDVAPLLEENRVYTRFGLGALERTSHPGLRSLMDVANLSNRTISPRDISFRLGPRLNAAGRMQKADLALQVLTEDDPAIARNFAMQLDTENNNRQRLCSVIYQEARRQVVEKVDLEEESAIVVVGNDWHEGVIGIVASRLVEEFQRPAVVIALGQDGVRGKGSARSVDGLHLYKAMSRSRQRFESFGGHEMAAGFSLVRDQIDPFRKEIIGECRRQMESECIEPSLDIDLEMHLHQISDRFADEVLRLEPFGNGNPVPLFLSRHVKVAGRPQPMGQNGQHFSFFASQNHVAFRAVVFNRLDWLDEIERGTEYWDVVYSVGLNDYYAPPRIELRVEDMKPS